MPIQWMRGRGGVEDRGKALEGSIASIVQIATLSGGSHIEFLHPHLSLSIRYRFSHFPLLFLPQTTLIIIYDNSDTHNHDQSHLTIPL
jgi:hypothetical protein